MEEKFYRKNDIGVNIEYYVIGIFKEEDVVYSIYTDFVTDKSSKIGIRLFVDKVVGDKYEKLSDKEAALIIKKFDSNIIKKLEEK